MKYLSDEEVLFIHSVVIDETGGSHGVRDIGLLRSAVAQPRQSFDQRDLYPSLLDKAAALLSSLIKNHPFVDGNKRTATTAAGVFLSLNGWELIVDQNSLAAYIERVAGEEFRVEEVAEWLQKHSKHR